VKTELKMCPFDGAPALTAFVQAGISWWQVECSKCTAHVDAPTEAAAITAWNTRATQPLSLTVDEGLASSVRSLHALTVDDVARNGPMSSTMVRAGLLLDILDRLQSLSLPVGR
jgi:hypothetical protein